MTALTGNLKVKLNMDQIENSEVQLKMAYIEYLKVQLKMAYIKNLEDQFQKALLESSRNLLLMYTELQIENQSNKRLMAELQ